MTLGRADIEAEARQLREQIATLAELVRQGVPVAEQKADVERQLAEIEASITGSPGAQQVIGDNNITIYVQAAVDPSAQAEVRRQFDDYLASVWERLINVPLLAISRRGASDKHVPLTAVYTPPDVTATVTVDAQQGELARRARVEQPEELKIPPDDMTDRSRVQGLQGDADYLRTLAARVEAESETARAGDRPPPGISDREAGYYRRVTTLEAAAAAPAGTVGRRSTGGWPDGGGVAGHPVGADPGRYVHHGQRQGMGTRPRSAGMGRRDAAQVHRPSRLQHRTLSHYLGPVPALRRGRWIHQPGLLDRGRLAGEGQAFGARLLARLALGHRQPPGRWRLLVRGGRILPLAHGVPTGSGEARDRPGGPTTIRG